MATESNGVSESYKAGADMTVTGQYRFVELSAAETVTVCNGATDFPVGVLQNKPDTNQAARVMKAGRTRVISDGSGTAIVVGDKVGTDNAGRAVKKSSDHDYIMGRAMSPSSAAGTIIDVELEGPYTLSA